VSPEPVNVYDYERLAEETLDANAHAYFAGGAGDEVTMRENLAAFERRKLRPRVLVDVRTVTTRTTVLGTEIALPILIAPLALQRMAHPEGEVATARAAASAGTIMCLSTAATTRPAELAAAASGGRRWFQVYVFDDRSLTEELIGEAVDKASPPSSSRSTRRISAGANETSASTSRCRSTSRCPATSSGKGSTQLSAGATSSGSQASGFP
jgi:isopentenyl diphosphate isomerase/L-lactate dehydrogenase-like FMN-dependent dehydrogenase